jgi:REP element-mobilizing transposase RayT
MARKPRLFVPGATYHVYCRVARGEFVFDDPYEAEEFVEKVREIRDADDWRVLAWCLMGNHYHLVIKTGSIPLWRSMLRLQAGIARGFNKRRRYLGRLWQSRYRARIIDSTNYFRQVVSYVHLNPVAAGLVSDPVDYANSGHREIVGHRPTRLVDLSSVLIEFEDELGDGARDNYFKWIRNVAEAKWVDQGIEELPWWKSARDKDEIAAADEHPEAETYDGQSLNDDRIRCRLDEFVDLFERFTGRAIQDLASPLKTPALVEGRIELTLLGVSRYGVRSSDLAALLNKHPSSMSRWLNDGVSLERKDPTFLRRINHLDRQISAAARNNE